MPHKKIVATLLALALPLLGIARARADEAGASPEANAAMKYWQAFALLPPLDRSQEAIVEQWNKVPFDEATLGLLARSQPSLAYLRRGSAIAHCDWSLNYDDGIFLVLPHMPRALTLAHLAALDARHQFDQGHWKEGADDISAILRLARHVEGDPLILVNLVGDRIQSAAVEAAAPYLPRLKPILPETLSATLKTLPARPTLEQLVLKEKQVSTVWLITALKQADERKPGSWREIWDTVFLASETLDRSAAQSVQSCSQAVKVLEDLLPRNDELARLAVLPSKQFDTRYARFASEVKASSPLSSVFLPALDRYVASERRSETQLALLKTAIAIVERGPARVRETTDPFATGPFAYRALRGGFELKSKLLYKGQPVSLTVGRPASK